jgi:hypothetical protein
MPLARTRGTATRLGLAPSPHCPTGHRRLVAGATGPPPPSSMGHNAWVGLEATMGLAHEHNALFHFSFQIKLNQFQ